MFLGHYAVDLAARPAARRIPLWVLFLAVQWPDLLWPILLLLGVEQVRVDPGNTAVAPLDFVRYPMSHSLLLDLAWGALLAAVVWVKWRDVRGALVAGASLVSHWVLDWVAHRPDMPLWPGGPKVGLELWRSVPATVAVELALLALGVWLYVRTDRARDAVGRWAWWALLAFLLVVYASNLLGPPPPSETALAWVSFSLWLLLPWAAWIDRYRGTRGEVAGEG